MSGVPPAVYILLSSQVEAPSFSGQITELSLWERNASSPETYSRSLHSYRKMRRWEGRSVEYKQTKNPASMTKSNVSPPRQSLRGGYPRSLRCLAVSSGVLAGLTMRGCLFSGGKGSRGSLFFRTCFVHPRGSTELSARDETSTPARSPLEAMVEMMVLPCP